MRVQVTTVTPEGANDQAFKRLKKARAYAIELTGMAAPSDLCKRLEAGELVTFEHNPNVRVVLKQIPTLVNEGPEVDA